MRIHAHIYLFFCVSLSPAARPTGGVGRPVYYQPYAARIRQWQCENPLVRVSRDCVQSGSVCRRVVMCCRGVRSGAGQYGLVHLYVRRQQTGFGADVHGTEPEQNEDLRATHMVANRNLICITGPAHLQGPLEGTFEARIRLAQPSLQLQCSTAQVPAL